MTRSLMNCRTAAIITAALAVGITAPVAGAKPIDFGRDDSFIATSGTSVLAKTPSAASDASGGGVSEWEVVVAGSAGASVALVGIGAGLVTSRRRRHRRTAARPTVAA